MKKILSKIFIIICVIGLIAIMLSSSQVQATLQSNPNTHYTKRVHVTNWITNFRNMEKVGGALGLSETIDGTTLLSTSESNNLDSHMIRSTEFGAIAILSASGYGNPKVVQDSIMKTTTGNETGIYFNFSVNSSNYGEYVAGLFTGDFSGVDERYYDLYTGSRASAKVGDALGTADTINPGCANWHSASHDGWGYSGNNYMVRNYVRSLFSYYYEYAGNTGIMHNSRGVIVCGEGF